MRFLNPSLLLVVPRSSQPRIRLMRGSEHILTQLKRQSLEQRWMRVESLIEVKLQGRFRWNIGCFLIEPSMDVDIVLDHEACVSEAIDVGQLVPIR